MTLRGFLKSLKVGLKFLLFFPLVSAIKLFAIKNRNCKKILVIKPDGIGDYALFRSLIHEIKKHYFNKEIDLLCSKQVESLALKLDGELINQFIFIDTIRFEKDISYFIKILKQISTEGYEQAIYPVYSRSPMIDFIAYSSNAKRRFAMKGDISNSSRIVNYLSQFLYTDIIKSTEETLFEFKRIERFLSDIFNYELRITFSNVHKPKHPNKIIIFPGASSSDRQWPGTEFIKIIDYLSTSYYSEILICGSNADSKICAEIYNNVNKNIENIKNLAGQTNLYSFYQTIKDSDLLISNDTGAIHLAALAGTPFICISNGKHFGRYTPYPDEFGVSHCCIYPNETFYDKSNFNTLKEKFKFGSDINIRAISYEMALQKIIEYIPKLSN